MLVANDRETMARLVERLAQDDDSSEAEEEDTPSPPTSHEEASSSSSAAAAASSSSAAATAAEAVPSANDEVRGRNRRSKKLPLGGS